MIEVVDRPAAISPEQYVEMMRKWIRVSVHRSVRKESGSLFAREDMEQEAVFALMETYQKYPEKFAAGLVDEVSAIGRRAIFYHVGNLYYRTGAQQPRCGACEDCRPELRPAAAPLKKKGHASVLERIAESEGEEPQLPSAWRRPCRAYALARLDEMFVDFDANESSQLDRLLVREAVEEVARESDEARAIVARAFANVSAHERAPEDGVAARTRRLVSELRGAEKIFIVEPEAPPLLPAPGERRVVRKLKASIADALGIHTRVADKHQHTGGRMSGGQGPIGPDEVVEGAETGHASTGDQGAPSGEKKTPKARKAAAPKSAQAPAKKSARDAKAAVEDGPKRQTAAQTKAASSAFKKDDKVVISRVGRRAELKVGTALVVRGTVMSRGRMYVRCVVVSTKRKISLSSALLKHA